MEFGLGMDDEPTANLWKMMEQLMLEITSRQLKNKKIIRSSKHGFTKGKSYLTNLIHFYNETTSLSDKGTSVGIFYIDFSRAFDTISHKILIGKLLKYGLNEQTM
ncbi:hypothetical protein HGM15179_018520 [Zosterops borbonicus]|uniref:Reverse transcriptase domain-containing protein n=1 Tax=Zosterops borbonicus TaxID=364589 RepID=A0A8K1LC23_9PASS|nr:hypothetical protein HGM15179_018520 [Zosterops borbonicus]